MTYQTSGVRSGAASEATAVRQLLRSQTVVRHHASPVDGYTDEHGGATPWLRPTLVAGALGDNANVVCALSAGNITVCGSTTQQRRGRSRSRLVSLCPISLARLPVAPLLTILATVTALRGPLPRDRAPTDRPPTGWTSIAAEVCPAKLGTSTDVRLTCD